MFLSIAASVLLLLITSKFKVTVSLNITLETLAIMLVVALNTLKLAIIELAMNLSLPS